MLFSKSFAFLLLLITLLSPLSVSAVTITATSTSSSPTFIDTNIGALTNAQATGGANATVQITIAATFTAGISVGSITTASLPAGAVTAAIGVGGQAAFGYTVSSTATVGTSSAFTITVTTPALTNYASLIASGNVLTVYYYNATAQTYTAIPSSQYSPTMSGAVAITINVAGSYYYTFQGNVTAQLGVAYLVAANSAQNFFIAEGTTADVLAIKSLNAAAGTIQITATTAAAAETNAIAQGNAYLSKIYTFTHSAGEGAVTSAVLAFDTSKSATAQAALTANSKLQVSSARWYTYVSASTSWQLQGGSVSASGSVISYTTTHFSDWSVQASANPNGAFGMASVSFGLIHLLLAALAIVLFMP